MALQEVCGFRDAPVYPRWNTPASLSMATRHSVPHSGGWDWEEPNATTGGSGHGDGPPLSLYIPDPGRSLSQNPLRPAAAPFQLCHGTTTLAFAFQGGVVAAADTRASCQGLVSCPDVRKVLPVHGRLVMTLSGSASDCVAWRGILARELRLYRLRNRRQLSPSGAAKLLAHMLHPFKGTDVCVAAMLCGWEEGAGRASGAERDQDGGKEGGRGTEPIGARGRGTEPIGAREAGPIRGREAEPIGGSGRETEPIGARGRETEPIGAREAGPGRRGGPREEGGDSGGPRLFYVCSDGTRLQGELFSVGSGSPYAYSVLDGDGGVRWGMGAAEAFRLAREAVYRAGRRDAYSGNCVDLYHVTAEGWRRADREDLREEYYRERERETERVEERRRERERS